MAAMAVSTMRLHGGAVADVDHVHVGAAAGSLHQRRGLQQPVVRRGRQEHLGAFACEVLRDGAADAAAGAGDQGAAACQAAGEGLAVHGCACKG
jgi:hypothetical protein